MPKFERNNPYGKLGGRQKGSRNKLDAFAYAVVVAHAQLQQNGAPPPEEYANTNLWKALNVTLRESPRDYWRQVNAMLPKQVSVEHSTVTELSDEDLDQMIEDWRAEAPYAH
jgi:hypothetical protein